MGEGKIIIGPTDALIPVDLQNDFCQGGALPAPRGHKIIPTINHLADLFQRNNALVAVSLEWHPWDHCSFKVNGGQFAIHCVQGTPGADLHPALNKRLIDIFVYKGIDKYRDAHSAFQGLVYKHPGEISCDQLDAALRWYYYPKIGQAHIKRIFITGIATEYCVKATVIDGINLYYEVYVVTDAIAAIKSRDGKKALDKMVFYGAKLCTSKDLL